MHCGTITGSVLQIAAEEPSPRRNVADAAKEIDMSDILYVVMPAYNEEENIESVVKGW